MPNRFNQRNLRNGTGQSAYDPAGLYDPKSFDERVEQTREQHSRKSTADKVSDDLSRVLDGLDDVRKALNGDDDARKRVEKGTFADADGEPNAGNPVEKAARAAEDVDKADPDVPNLPDQDYSGAVDLDSEPMTLRKSTDTVDDVSKGVDDTAPDRNSELSIRNNDDTVAVNPRMVDPDDGN